MKEVTVVAILINVQCRQQFCCEIKVTAPPDTAKLPGIISRPA